MSRLPPRPPGSLPAVSVVIPTYNYGHFLQECLNSVTRQAGVNLEIVVVDDGSTDDTAAICERLLAEDPRARVIRHEQNRGHIATFNDALASASHPYIVKLDADDCLPQGSLLRSASLLQSHPDVAFAYGQPFAFRDGVPDLQPVAVHSWSVWPGREWLERRVRRGRNVIMQPEVMIRRTALEQVGGHRADVAAASDFHLWLRLSTVGAVGRVNGPIQGLYRVHPGSMQRTVHAGKLADVLARRDAFDLFFDEDAPASLRTLRPRAHRTLALQTIGLAQRALDRQQGAAEPVEEYLEAAVRLDPSVGLGAAARVVRMRKRFADRGFASAASATPGAVYRDLEDRVRWRAWRRYGR
jgi:glycosyltransferase involved in cell wall biosynthesis